MDTREIGNLIHYERMKRDISLGDLANGLCSAAVIQRLESGERMPDFFIVERVIGRLGKSINKIELLYNEDAYEIYYLREVIENYAGYSDYDSALDALAYYESLPEAKEPLHRQYICKMQAVICGQEKQNHGEAARLLEEAVEQTVPGFVWKEFDRYLLGEEELLLLLMCIWEKMSLDIEGLTVDEAKFLRYIEQICQDEEMLANVYSKAAWVFSHMEEKRQNREGALRYALEGENILAQNGILMNLPQFLERILGLTEKAEPEAYAEWKKQRDALKWVYESYGVVYETSRIMLWKSYRQQEVYLVSELFGQERKLSRQSQEKLADALNVDQKTISRIESGRYKPKRGTFRKMKEYFQIDRDICSTRIVTEDFELLEVEREVAKKSHYRRYEEAERLYLGLKDRISMEWNENLQYVKYMDAFFARQKGEITDEQALVLCMEAFRVTRKNLALEQVDKIVPGRREAMILNYIALCYDRMGEKEKAIELLEKVKCGYESSKVDLKYHYVGVTAVYYNLSADYEECNLLSESIQLCEKGIRFEINCKRGLALGFYIVQKAYARERMTDDKKGGKNDYLQAYQIFKLMKKQEEMKSLQKVYSRYYGEDID